MQGAHLEMEPGAASASRLTVIPRALATPVSLTAHPDLYVVVERINLPSLQVVTAAGVCCLPGSAHVHDPV